MKRSFKTDPPGVPSLERRLEKARQSMQEHHAPGEHLQVALLGSLGGPSLSQLGLELLAALTGGTAGGRLDTQPVLIGLTEQELVIVELHVLNRRTKLKRWPRSQVRLVEFKQGPLTDELIMDVGQAKPLGIQVSRLDRPGTQQLLDNLSS